MDAKGAGNDLRVERLRLTHPVGRWGKRVHDFQPQGATAVRTLLLAGALLALPRGVAQSGVAAPPRLVPVAIQKVRVDDEFWSPRRKVWRETTIPDCLAKFEKDGAIKNFDRVGDGRKGGHAGPPWYDGLIYEMIRGCADFLAAGREPVLEKRLDDIIEHVAAAQARSADGYLNTFTQLEDPAHRWGLGGGNDNWQHDVYNAGALCEAAVHYYRATGKTKLLEVAVREANCMCDTIGPPPRKNAIPGHSLAEEALAKLFLLLSGDPSLKRRLRSPVDERRYLELARFFIDARGHYQGRASFGAYGQDHMPVVAQPTIEGHAVRATLMCAGLSTLAAIDGRDDYRAAAERLWNNMTGRRMYITGGVGAMAEGEAFAADYVLPNDGYLETCAAIGSAFFSRDMNLLSADARHADELERVLYNGALCGVSLAGDTYAYVNPLKYDRQHARWAWHGCPCCPPMLLKIMGAMPGYIYAQDASGLYVNLFVGSRATTDVAATRVTLRQSTRYPWDGAVRIAVEPEHPARFDVCLRIPAWCRGPSSPDDLYRIEGLSETDGISLAINSVPVAGAAAVRGYLRLSRTWRAGDTVELTLSMPVRRVRAHPKVTACRNLVALMRGPLVYCLESTDPSPRMRAVFLPPDAPLAAEYQADVLGGVVAVKGGLRFRPAAGKPAGLAAIPYFTYGNRGPADMQVWIPETPDKAAP
jgi:DUF1680 family protein